MNKKTNLWLKLHLFLFTKGVLETSFDDFESGEDVYEAIGGVLQEVALDKTEDDIKYVTFTDSWNLPVYG